MKKLLVSILAIFLAFTLTAQQLKETLESIESVASVQKLESSVFSQKYLLKVTRPVNPEAAGEMTPDMQTYVKYADPQARRRDAGTFEQRVIVCHAGFDRPTVLVTEGYWADYALRPNYCEELARLLNTNIVVVEYRYFGESVPEACDWQYLTVANSLCDLHHVVEMSAVGGVKPENVKDYLDAGVCGFGVGGPLVLSAAVKSGDDAAIEARARLFTEAIRAWEAER